MTRHHPFTALALVVLLGSTIGCNRSPSATSQPSATIASAEPTLAASTPAKDTEPTSALQQPGARAEVGRRAPLFTLPNLDGEPVSLASFQGKTIVLEWFNPGCPFVQKSHEKGSLVDAAKSAQKQGVVWFAINSGGPGKQGHGVERNAETKNKWSLPHPILIDEQGEVGKAYGAKRTPHIFVIDDKGVLVYAGAVDNSPDGEGESPTDGKLVSYVETSLEALSSGQKVEPSKTEAYGCSVKYAE